MCEVIWVVVFLYEVVLSNRLVSEVCMTGGMRLKKSSSYVPSFSSSQGVTSLKGFLSLFVFPI